MRSHHGQAAAAPPAGPARGAVRPPFEPQHGGAEYLAPGEELPQPGLDRAEILADRQRVRVGYFGGQHATHQFVVVPHVGAQFRGHSGWYPPQPGQSHDVVHPQAAGVAAARRDQLGQRSARLGGEPPRVPRRQRPILTSLVELVRRRAHADAGHDDILAGPGVGAAGMRADREIGDHADAHAGPPGRPLRRGQLFRRQPLQPGMKLDRVGELLPELGDLARGRVGQRRGPGPPVRTVDLGDGAPRRPVFDRAAVTGQERVQRHPAARGQRHRADQLQRGALGDPEPRPGR